MSLVYVTGAHGFLGKYVCKELEKRKHVVLAPTRTALDLGDLIGSYKFLSEKKPDIVIHLAAECGGIGANRHNPADFFYLNLYMGTNLLHHCFLTRVKKFVGVGTVCSYPKHTPIPFREEDLWNGYPEETNAPYGLAKKMLLVQGQAYRQQYAFNAIHLLQANLYGPGDNFDPSSSHVIPAIIRKMVDAKLTGAERVVLWGTGRPTREFLYVEDAARGICDAAEKYNKPEPVNLGTGMEVSVQFLADKIAAAVGYTGRIDWDTSQPDGQPRRRLDISKAQLCLDWLPQVDLKEGLRRTIEWWEAR